MVGEAGKEFSNTEALLFLLISRQMRKTSKGLLRKPVRSALELGKPKDWSSVSSQGRLWLRFGLVSWCQCRESLGSTSLLSIQKETCPSAWMDSAGLGVGGWPGSVSVGFCLKGAKPHSVKIGVLGFWKESLI